jgi:SAM-dependent methyltransferase
VLIAADARADDTHKLGQAEYFDSVDAEFEISRPHGTPALYRWLLGEKFRRSVSSLRPLAGGSTALTVCGGSGMDAEFLARTGARVVVADLSLEAVRRALERARRQGLSLGGVVADVERLPFADRSFDLVYVHDGLHHLEDPLVGLAEMSRVARRAVSVNEPADARVTALAVRVGFAYEVEDAGNPVARVDPSAIVSSLESSGFRIVACRRYGMYYRHEPGSVFRLLSRQPLLAAAQLAVGAFNRVAGGVGNKLTVQAVREPTAGVD